jgi:hypothetical protein
LLNSSSTLVFFASSVDKRLSLIDTPYLSFLFQTLIGKR